LAGHGTQGRRYGRLTLRINVLTAFVGLALPVGAAPVGRLPRRLLRLPLRLAPLCGLSDFVPGFASGGPLPRRAGHRPPDSRLMSSR